MLLLEYILKCDYAIIILMHISCFMISDKNLLLAVYFILTVDYGNDVRQKANLSDFLIQVQNRLYSSEENLNINNAFGPGTATNVQCSGGSRNFAREF